MKQTHHKILKVLMDSCFNLKSVSTIVLEYAMRIV